MRSQWNKDIRRVVVKLGTGVLTDADKRPDPAQFTQLVDQMAGLRARGLDVLLVTSGAVGAGMGILGYDERPADLAAKQACAAVGQPRLMTIYEQEFKRHGLGVGQVLLTHDDFQHDQRRLNARNTLTHILERGVVPIINENDAVSFAEIKFGDNDRLSALVASLMPADLLVILTTVDGMIENFGLPNAKIMRRVERIDDKLESMAGGTTSATAVGGMSSKIQAAKIVVSSGIPLVIASGQRKNALERIIDGREEGTLFIPGERVLNSAKRKIAFFRHSTGTIFVDNGARKALREGGGSLLQPGVTRCEGDFPAGAVVRVCDVNGIEFARGLAGASAEQIRVGELPRKMVIHRNNLVVL